MICHAAFAWKLSHWGQPLAHPISALPRCLQQHVLQPPGEPRDAGRGLWHQPGGREERELLDPKEQVGVEVLPYPLPLSPPGMARPPLLLGLLCELRARQGGDTTGLSPSHGTLLCSCPLPLLALPQRGQFSPRGNADVLNSLSLPAAGRRRGASRATSAC